MNITEATNNFIADLAITKSENTVSTYSVAMKHLCSVCGDEDVSTFGPDTVPMFVRWLHENNPVSQASLNLYLVALTRFYKWLALSRLVDSDLIRFQDWVQQYTKKVRRKAPKVPNEGDVQTLLQCMYASVPTPTYPDKESGRNIISRWLRDIALVETWRATGCRINEALSLKVGDVKDGVATLKDCKGDKDRVVFWDDKAREAVEKYVAYRGAGPDDFLFDTHDWRYKADPGITDNQVREILAGWCERAGIKPFTPHQLRHRFAKKALEQTHDIRLVQDWLGHESPATTQVYTQFMPDELKREHGNLQL